MEWTKLTVAAILAFLIGNIVTADEKKPLPGGRMPDAPLADAGDATGGVSAENPIKLTKTERAGNCTLMSEEDSYVEWAYVGSFLNGSVFATGPFSAVLGHGYVVPGVDTGMRGLCVGDKRQMVIHSDQAYGDDGRPPKIPGKATLIFDVDVKKVETTGGVSGRKQLKTEWVHRVENCTKESDAGDFIEWKYKGALLNGSVFDQGTYSCTLGQRSVIMGVEEGMKGLCPGDKRKMTMHSDWGYGDQGTKGIPGGATLVFDVEVIKVNQDTGLKDEL